MPMSKLSAGWCGNARPASVDVRTQPAMPLQQSHYILGELDKRCRWREVQMNTVSRAADVESLKIHYALESDNKNDFQNALQEVHAYEAMHPPKAAKTFQAELNKDLQDVLPQMSLMWAQDHQSDLAKFSSNSETITKQGIADYEIKSISDPTHSSLDKSMGDSLRQNWDKYSNQGDGRVRTQWDSITDNKHLNQSDIEAALAPINDQNAARLTVSELARTPQADDSLFRKISEDGDGKQITPISLRNALANDDASFIDHRERSSAQYLLNHYEDFDKYNGGQNVYDPGVYRSEVTGAWEASNHYHVAAPITVDTLNQYAQAKFGQPATEVSHNTDVAAAAAAGSRPSAYDFSGSTDRRSCDDQATDQNRPCSGDGTNADGQSAVPQQMYADAQVKAGEGFYQTAQRMLGTDAPVDEVLGLAHEFKNQYACDNNNADPTGLQVGYNFLDGYNRDDWNRLIAKYPSLEKAGCD